MRTLQMNVHQIPASQGGRRKTGQLPTSSAQAQLASGSVSLPGQAVIVALKKVKRRSAVCLHLAGDSL